MRRKSCKSHGERIITETLNSLNVYYKREMSFETCRSLKNRPLRFDFYIPEYNILIEFQGQHHYEPVNKYYRAKKVHEKTILHDNIKMEFVKRSNYKLIQIPYWDIENIRGILYGILGRTYESI